MAFDLGAMLKDVPKLDTGREQIEYIRLDLIDEDPNNFYQLTGIEELANNIATCGLQQPIRVRKSPENPDRYVIVSGHRRRKAVELLAQEEPDKWQEVACIVEQDAVSPALQQLRLIYANANTRKMSDAEVSEQAVRVENLLYQLKEEGYEFPGRMRDHVAAAVGASKSKLARLKVIRDNLATCWQPSFEDDSLGVSVAYALAQMPKSWQHLIFDAHGKYPRQVYEGTVREYMKRLQAISKIECGHSETKECDHKLEMMQKSVKANQWTDPCHTRCCMTCSELRTCRSACQRAQGEKARLRTVAKQAELDAAARQAERDRPGAEFARLVYERVGLARKASGATVQALFEAQRKIYSSSIDDPKQLMMEKGDGKWSPQTYLPFGYSMQANSVMVMCKVADALGCSLDYLLGRTDVMEVAKPVEAPQPINPGGLIWQTGTPPHEGDYILLLSFEFYCNVEEWVWDGAAWHDCCKDPHDPAVDGKIIGWIPMPEVHKDA